MLLKWQLDTKESCLWKYSNNTCNHLNNKHSTLYQSSLDLHKKISESENNKCVIYHVVIKRNNNLDIEWKLYNLAYHSNSESPCSTILGY